MRFGVEPTSFLLPAWASRRRWHGADSAALIVASCTFLVLALGSAAHAQAVRESTWVTDGTVNAIAGTGSTLFLGGTFSRVGPWVGGAGVVDRGTGSAVKPYPRVAGTVFASTADGAAGWYIGGAFTRVQGQPRRNLAHLRADGSVDAWNPGADTTVRALVRAGSVVYAGGDFSSVGGAARKYLAAIDASSGAATSWDPEPSKPVSSLLASGSTLYAGGSFRLVAGGAAPGVVSFDISTGARLPTPLQGPTSGGRVLALARNGNRLDVAGSFSHAGPPTGAGSFLDATTAAPVAPFFDVVGQVRAIESDGSGGWYLGGEFTSVLGTPRTNLARVLANGSVAPWNPGTDDTVRAIAVTPARIYVGGDFNKCGGKPHARIAAVDPANGSVLAWDPVLSVTTADSVLYNVVLRVNALLLSGNTLYAGGGFTSVAGAPRQNLVAFDAPTGALLPSQPFSTSNPVRALAAGGGNAFAGGSFGVVGDVAPGFVSIDASTGAMSPPGQFGITRQFAAVVPNGSVAAIAPDGSGGWYIGGVFSAIQGQGRSNLAHLRADGSLDAWNPVIGTVYTLAIANGRLYVGGSFTLANGQARSSLAAFDVATGNLLPWAPVLSGSGTVTSVLAMGDTVYFCGAFSTVGGVPRAFIASVHGTTGALTSWNPAPAGPSGRMLAAVLAAANNSILVLGEFFHIGGADRLGLAALDPITATARPWDPNVAGVGDFGALAVSGDMVYVGGSFTSVGGTARKYLAKISLTTGALEPWLPNDPDDFVHALAIVGNTVYVGGQFGSVGGAPHSNLAALDATTGAAAPGNFATDGEVDALVAASGQIGVGGGFAIGAGFRRNHLAGFVLASQAPLFFNPDPDGPVNSLAVSGSTVYFGGEFTHVGGSVRLRLAAQDLNLGLQPWNPASSQIVRAVAVQGTTVYVGGLFTTINGFARKFLAATDATTGAIASWSPVVDGSAYVLRALGGAIFAGGAFTSVGGMAAGDLALIDATTGGITAVPPATPSGDIQAVADAGGNLYVGGKFDLIGGSPRARLAAFDASGALLPWDPDVIGGDLPAVVNALAVVSDTLYVAGDFLAIGGQPRLRLAALDLPSGMPLPWTADAAGVLSTLASDGSRLLAGGQPGSVGMVPRSFLAAFDAASGEVHPWSVALDADVHSLCASGGRLYAGGDFSTLAGNSMQQFAVLDTATGTPLTSNMALDGPVEAIVASAGRVYLGGGFSAFGGQPRSRLAALDSVSLVVDPWNPGANFTVQALAAANSVIYAGGVFTFCGHQTRRAIAAIDPVTGQSTPWNPGSNGSAVSAIAVEGGVVYVGGQFPIIGGQARSNLAALDPATGLATSWNPTVGGPVTALSAADGTVFVATKQPQFITFSESTAQPGSWLPEPDGVVHAIFRANGTIDLGGAFQVIAGETRPSFAAFADPAFVPTLGVPRRGPFAGIELAQNRPNPFRSATTIHFSLPEAGHVRLGIVDVGGRLVRTLLDTEAMSAGEHEVRIDAAGLRPGLYWYRLETDRGVMARRMVLVQ